MNKNVTNESSHILLGLNKKAMTGLQQFLAIILIVLAIGLLFIMIFRVDILSKLQNIPSWGFSSSPNDEQAIVSGKDEMIKSTLCDVQVGFLSSNNLKKCTLAGSTGFDCKVLVDTGLSLAGSFIETKGPLSWVGSNLRVGNIGGGSKIIFNEGTTKVSEDVLANFNGAIILSDGRVCVDKLSSQ